MHFGLARYDWKDGAYRPPRGTVGAVDLRPSSYGWGPVAVCSAVPIPRDNLLRPFADATEALDYVWRQLTRGSDPRGCAAPKPLLPMSNGQLLLRLGTVSRTQRFRLSSPHADRVRAVFQNDFEQLWEATNGHEHCRRVLDMTCETYGGSWRLFVPRRLQRHVAGRLLHATTVSDNFNRPNESLTTPWAGIVGTLTVTSSMLRCNSQPAHAYYNSPLSTANMETVVKLDTREDGGGGGPIARKTNSTAETGYLTWCDGLAGHLLYKVVAGSLTELDTGGTTWTSGDDMLVGANGSSIYSKRNGVSDLSATDTDISGVLYAGFRGYDFNLCRFDNWEASDIAAPSKFWIFGPKT